MVIALLILGWLACAVFTAGAWFAYFQGEYRLIADEKRGDDLRNAWFAGLLGGPIAAVVLLLDGALKHGWRLK